MNLQTEIDQYNLRCELCASERQAQIAYESACEIVEKRFFMKSENIVKIEGCRVYIPFLVSVHN